MNPPENKKLIPCPKCKNHDEEFKRSCPACKGAGELLLTRIIKTKGAAQGTKWN